MAPGSIKFSTGSDYDHSMGDWSRLVGKQFLEWLEIPDGQRWVEIGCGNGCFTRLLVDECSPMSIRAIDPLEAQIEYARRQLTHFPVEFQVGSALDLPYANESCDAAVMALVLFFVPDPRRSVDEMRRVVREGGVVASYVWDTLGGGFPHAPVQEELAALDVKYPLPPSIEISPLEPARQLWLDAGLEDVQCKVVEVERTFRDFDDMWSSFMVASVGRVVDGLDERTRDMLRRTVREKMHEASDGSITYASRANCVKGRVPNGNAG